MTEADVIRMCGSLVTISAVIISAALQRRRMRALRTDVHACFDELHASFAAIRQDFARTRLK